MKFKAWPNNLGVSATTRAGRWDVFKATSSSPCCANFFPRGECYATRHGHGATPQEAIRNAKSIMRT
jgi:hypothetical protein